MRIRARVRESLFAVVALGAIGCSKEPGAPVNASSGKPADSFPKVNLPPLVERARLFDPKRPWKDFEPDEQEVLKSPLPVLTLPEPLSERTDPPDIQKKLAEFEQFVHNSEDAKKNPTLMQKLEDFRRNCLQQFKNPIWSQFPGMARHGGWFQGQIEAEAQKVVNTIVEYHQMKGQAPLNAQHNAAAGRMQENWDKVRKDVAAVSWESAPFRETLIALGEGITTLQSNDPAHVLQAQGVRHPKMQEFREQYLKLARAVTDKASAYLKRVPYFRLKHYAAAAGASASGDAKKTLDLVSLFIGGDPGIDLGGLKPELVSLAQEHFKAETEQLLPSAKSMIARFRGKIRPDTADQAVIMYEARDLRHRTRHVENTPGSWCAYTGKYEGRKSGYHLIRMGDVEYVAFETSENLSNIPDGVKLTIVGQYERLIEYTRVIGSTGRAPYLKGSLVFRHP